MSRELFVIDVDGTMTDGNVYYDNTGNEFKKFNVKDAAGFFAIHADNSEVMVLTGRECIATEKRMKELKVDYLFQNIRNKDEFLSDFIKKNCLGKRKIVYIGDDLNDFAAMKLADIVYCPKDACAEIKRIAQYVSKKCGGDGAVRDIIEYHYRKENKWGKLIEQIYYKGGI